MDGNIYCYRSIKKLFEFKELEKQNITSDVKQ